MIAPSSASPFKGSACSARLDQLGEVVRARHVDEVVIAMPKAARGAVLRNLVRRRGRPASPRKVVPGVFELLEGGVSVSRLREVDITDLLRRRPIVAAPDTGQLPA